VQALVGSNELFYLKDSIVWLKALLLVVACLLLNNGSYNHCVLTSTPPPWKLGSYFFFLFKFRLSEITSGAFSCHLQTLTIEKIQGEDTLRPHSRIIYLEQKRLKIELLLELPISPQLISPPVPSASRPTG